MDLDRAPAIGQHTLIEEEYGASPTPAAPGKRTLVMMERARLEGGAPLPPSVGHLGAPAAVRVHTGAASQEAAAAMGARAYTDGAGIHLGAGQYDPSSRDGRHLLAHEVAHTIQQDGAPSVQAKLALSEPGDAAELEADRFADAVVEGIAPPPIRARPVGDVVHRDKADGGVETPAAPATSILFEGDTLTTDDATLQAILDRRGKDHGLDGVTGFYDELAARVRAIRAQKKDAELPGTPSAGTPHDWENLPTYEAILAALTPKVEAYKTRAAAFEQRLAKTSKDAVYGLLDDSKARVDGEAKRYGIVEMGTNAATGATLYGKADNDDTKGLTAAVAALTAKLAAIEDAKAQIETATQKEYNAAIGGEVTKILDAALYTDGEAKRLRGEKDLSTMRSELEGKYPILAAFTSKEQLAKLGAGGLSAKTLGTEIADRLDKIATSRKLVESGAVDPYGIERAVGTTKVMLAVAPGSFEDALVKKHVEHAAAAKAQAEDSKVVLEVLDFAFALLSFIPATAPIGVVGGAITGTLTAVEAAHEYEMSALGGTDFDRNLALVAGEDRSLTWLAFQILSAGFAVMDAVKIFRVLAVEARAAVAGEKLTEKGAAAEAEEALRAQGNQAKAGLGDELVVEARHRKVVTASGEELEVALKAGGTKRPVVPAEIQVLYLKGKPGAMTEVDGLAGEIQVLSAKKATELRGLAELAENRGTKTLEEAIPGYATMPKSVQNYLKYPKSDAHFGTALQMMCEPELAAHGMEIGKDLLYRKQFMGIPDIQGWPASAGGEVGFIIDWTTDKAAGKALKYDGDQIAVIVEIVQPGP